MSVVDDKSTQENAADFKLSKLIGPGLMVAAAGIGAGDMVSATMGGAGYGLTILWAVALAAFLKCFLNEGIARWQLATNTTAIEGWCSQMPWWVRTYFGIYLVIWTGFVTAALMNACGLGIENLTGGAIPRSWGAVLHSVIGAVFVLIGGFKGFEKIMKALITAMFFSILSCAVLTFHDPVAFLKGLTLPSIPAGAGATVLSVLGGIGGSITMLAYNYWIREEKMVGPRWVKYIRADITIAYVFTALFGIAVMSIANQAFHTTGTQITNATAVTRMAQTLGATIGPIGFWAYSIGFWAAVFASLLGVWQSVPYLFADFWGLIRRYPENVRAEIIKTTSTPYRMALLYVTLAPMPFAFMNAPLQIVRAYTIVGSLFIPFLAATLLYLNNRRLPTDTGVNRNSIFVNAVLILALILFALVGAREAGLLRI
jgi:Mn2+/Fe2+ NRAMP family transporter